MHHASTHKTQEPAGHFHGLFSVVRALSGSNILRGRKHTAEVLPAGTFLCKHHETSQKLHAFSVRLKVSTRCPCDWSLGAASKGLDCQGGGSPGAAQPPRWRWQTATPGDWHWVAGRGRNCEHRSRRGRHGPCPRNLYLALLFATTLVRQQTCSSSGSLARRLKESGDRGRGKQERERERTERERERVGVGGRRGRGREREREVRHCLWKDSLLRRWIFAAATWLERS